MPNSSLKYDPTTPEGEAIGNLFRACKSIEDADGGWNGGDTVDLVCNFFTRLGIDIKRDIYQVDAIPPLAISTEAAPDGVAKILATRDDFTTNGYPTGNEGFFYAKSVNDRTTDFTLLTFPTASGARVRTALAVLRAAGYTATEQAPTALDTRARTIHVHRGALHPLPDDASTTDRASRLLQDAGFTHHPSTDDKVYVVSHTTPTPVGWRPGWVQIDVVAPPAPQAATAAKKSPAPWPPPSPPPAGPSTYAAPRPFTPGRRPSLPLRSPSPSPSPRARRNWYRPASSTAFTTWSTTTGRTSSSTTTSRTPRTGRITSLST